MVVDQDTRLVSLSTDDRSTEFMFMDMNDNVVTSVMPNLKYVFVTVLDGVFLVMHMDINGVLTMVNEREVNTLGRVYIAVPSEFPGNSGYSRFIYTAVDEVKQLVWPGSNDIVLIDDINMNINCIGDCVGKRCNESNGCGSLCGCGVGNTCMPDGTCEVQSSNTQAATCRSNGTCAGRCFGTCPTGSTCVQNNTVFTCRVSKTFPWIIIAVIIFFSVLFLAIRKILF